MAKRMAPVVSLVGRSGSGKTTLLVELVRRLSRKGYRVGTIKHFRHEFETDQPGKDSYRHFHAGSAAAMIVSDDKLALVERLARPMSLAALARDYFPGLDLVLAEGFKQEKGPRIEVLRSAVDPVPLSRPRGDGLIALVSDRPLAGYPQPRFRPDQAGRLALFLEREFLRPPALPDGARYS